MITIALVYVISAAILFGIGFIFSLIFFWLADKIALFLGIPIMLWKVRIALPMLAGTLVILSNFFNETPQEDIFVLAFIIIFTIAGVIAGALKMYRKNSGNTGGININQENTK